MIPQGPGDIGVGEAQQSGEMFVDLNGKRYEGEFTTISDGSVTTSGFANANAYGSGGYGTTSVSGASNTRSQTGGGKAFLRSIDGEMIRCEFRYENQGFGGSAIGQCLHDDGQVYDLTMKVG